MADIRNILIKKKQKFGKYFKQLQCEKVKVIQKPHDHQAKNHGRFDFITWPKNTWKLRCKID